MPKTTKTPGSALMSLLAEYDLNPFALSKAVGLSYATIRLILFGESKLSISAALRFSKFFGNTPAFWLDLQRETDLIEAENDKKLQSALKVIKRAVKPSAASKAPAKARRKTTLSDKRKKAAKAPGSKAALRKKRKG
ncbi:MAG: HigA family addiction module antidote protein [Treponema sp.]|jgi:addiction module HigA family antidote|nr:HigA family addiction module antidote protein [Treponema sp.]